MCIRDSNRTFRANVLADIREKGRQAHEERTDEGVAVAGDEVLVMDGIDPVSYTHLS